MTALHFPLSSHWKDRTLMFPFRVVFNQHISLAIYLLVVESSPPSLVGEKRQWSATQSRSHPDHAESETAQKRAALLRLRQPSQSTMLVNMWIQLLSLFGRHSQLYNAVSSSENIKEHCGRVLDGFAPSTVLKYMTTVSHLFQLCTDMHCNLFHLSPVELTDLLITSSLSRSSDAAAAGGKAIIKAMRWACKLAMVPDLLDLFYHPLVNSILIAKRTFDRQETAPLCLWALIQFERRILQSSTPVNDILFLGACLLTTFEGLRFSDSQRTPLTSMVLGQGSLRGICEKTKTTHRGQPFGLVTCGFLSFGSEDWCTKYLRILDTVWCDSGIASLDSLFIQWDGAHIQTLSYAAALNLLRHMLPCPWRSGESPLAGLQINFAMHSLKTTLLACAVQVPDLTEEQRMLQGHHKRNTSLRVYSRDEVFGQLSLQRHIISKVHQGWRPTLAQHRGSQLPMKEPDVTLERFRKDQPPYEWKRFKFSSAPASAEVINLDPVPPQEASQSSDSSDSSSSSSEPTKTAREIPANPPATISDEIFVAWTTSIQDMSLMA